MPGTATPKAARPRGVAVLLILWCWPAEMFGLRVAVPGIASNRGWRFLRRPEHGAIRGDARPQSLGIRESASCKSLVIAKDARSESLAICGAAPAGTLHAEGAGTRRGPGISSSAHRCRHFDEPASRTRQCLAPQPRRLRGQQASPCCRSCGVGRLKCSAFGLRCQASPRIAVGVFSAAPEHGAIRGDARPQSLGFAKDARSESLAIWGGRTRRGPARGGAGTRRGPGISSSAHRCRHFDGPASRTRQCLAPQPRRLRGREAPPCCRSCGAGQLKCSASGLRCQAFFHRAAAGSDRWAAHCHAPNSSCRTQRILPPCRQRYPRDRSARRGRESRCQAGGSRPRATRRPRRLQRPYSA
jgi:hypothetical protein